MILPILLDPVKHEYTPSSYNQIVQGIELLNNGLETLYWM